MAMMAIFEISPIPNRIINNGRIDNFGIGYVIEINGVRKLAILLFRPIDNPRAMALGTEIITPKANRFRLNKTSFKNLGSLNKRYMNLKRIVAGEGKYILLMTLKCDNSSHSIKITAGAVKITASVLFI